MDGIRAISVALVIVSHLGHLALFRFDLWPPVGTLGVELFFGISGFVICRGLLRERASKGRISFVGFYARRFFRIVPPLALYVAVVLGLTALGVLGSEGASVWKALTFTCDVHRERCGGTLGGHTWSLSVEEQFYLVCPVLFAVTIHRSRAILAALAAIIPVCAIALFAIHRNLAGETVGYFCTITAGVTCALFEDQIRAVIARSPGWLLLIAAPALVVVWLLPAAPWTTAAKYCLAPALVMTVLMSAAYKPSRVRDLLSWRPLVAIGRVSYGIYLWQQIATHDFPGVTRLFYFVAIAVCLAWAFVSFRWLESPLIRFSRTIVFDGRSIVLVRPKRAESSS